MQGVAVESGGWVGREIAGRYQVERLVARGGMAVVYEATDRQLLRRIALKVLIPPPVEGGDFAERFRQEAQALASLQHPNIVTIHDYGSTEDDRWFLAMEYIDGLRLSDLLREGPLPMDRALALLSQVCIALRYAHKKGVIHRDLKPSNLLIQRAEDGAEIVKVVDFGLVKTHDSDQNLSQAGLVMGSPHFMAPEQVLSQATDARTDIYAVGVLLFRCLTGAFPFHGASATATMLAHVKHPIPSFASVTDLDLALPAGLEDITRRCLAKNPDDRYPDMKALLHALGPWTRTDSLGTLGTFGTSSLLQPIRLTPDPQIRRTWFIAGTLATLLVLSLGAWATSRLFADPVAPVAPPAPMPLTVEAPAPLTLSPPPPTAEATTGTAPADPVAPPATPKRVKTAEKAPAKTAEKPPAKEKPPEGYMPVPF